MNSSMKYIFQIIRRSKIDFAQQESVVRDIKLKKQPLLFLLSKHDLEVIKREATIVGIPLLRILILVRNFVKAIIAI